MSIIEANLENVTSRMTAAHKDGPGVYIIGNQIAQEMLGKLLSCMYKLARNLLSL